MVKPKQIVGPLQFDNSGVTILTPSRNTTDTKRVLDNGAVVLMAMTGLERGCQKNPISNSVYFFTIPNRSVHCISIVLDRSPSSPLSLSNSHKNTITLQQLKGHYNTLLITSTFLCLINFRLRIAILNRIENPTRGDLIYRRLLLTYPLKNTPDSNFVLLLPSNHSDPLFRSPPLMIITNYGFLFWSSSKFS